MAEWAKQTKADNYQKINAKEYLPYEDFEADPAGYYVLIRVDFASYRIELALCSPEHKIEYVITGRKAQDVYHELFTLEKAEREKGSSGWFHQSEHIAYIGKELKKAEIALAMGNSAYYQE